MNQTNEIRRRPSRGARAPKTPGKSHLRSFRMSWLAILAIAVISDALRIFIDNYASDYYFKENPFRPMGLRSNRRSLKPVAGGIAGIEGIFSYKH